MKFSDKKQNHSVNRIMQFSSIMIFFLSFTKTLWIGEKRLEQGCSQFSHTRGQINFSFKSFDLNKKAPAFHDDRGIQNMVSREWFPLVIFLSKSDLLWAVLAKTP